MGSWDLGLCGARAFPLVNGTKYRHLAVIHGFLAKVLCGGQGRSDSVTTIKSGQNPGYRGQGVRRRSALGSFELVKGLSFQDRPTHVHDLAQIRPKFTHTAYTRRYIFGEQPDG